MPSPQLTRLASDTLADVVDVARTHHTSRLSVSDLADVAGYSPFHFTRLFTASMRLTPGQYLTALRVDTAKRLLLAHSDPVIDVAVHVGFDSLSSFTRRFRTCVGVPPAALRTLARRVDDSPPRPFRIEHPKAQRATVTLMLPADVSPRVQVWLGWYPHPAPIGLPVAGMFADYVERLSLPLAPGAPWLLGFAIDPGSDAVHHVAPQYPLVAAHPLPVRCSTSLTLAFAHADAQSVPLLSALPSLCTST